MKTRERAKNPRGPFAGFFLRREKGITANPRTCEESQQASLSAKDQKLLALFEEDATVRFAVRTAEHYLADARVFVCWLARRALSLKDVRPADLERYHSELYALSTPKGRPYAPATIMLRLMAVKTLYRFLVRRSHVLFDPSSGIELPRTERKLPRVILTEEEARRIVTAPRGSAPRALRDRAILETLYGTGIRVDELLHLKPADVEAEEASLRVVKGKGGKQRKVPLTRVALRAVGSYLAHGRPALQGPRGVSEPWLFLTYRGRKLSRGEVGKIVKHWVSKARVKKAVSPHVFRHTVATHLLRRRADIRQIQALLGHGRLSTTERYTHVEIQDLKAVIERAHPRGR